jgi:endonuclease YncB( thermonuclease family)
MSLQSKGESIRNFQLTCYPEFPCLPRPCFDGLLIETHFHNPCSDAASLLSANGEEFTGRVVGISDGETISVVHDGRAEKMRLHGIDAPEKGQAFGTRAKRFTSDLAFGKDVRIEVKGQDRHGRTVAVVMLLDGRNVNREIVRAGLTWLFRYAPQDRKSGKT